jgi:uncharacterized protein (TIGR03085 family)
MTEYARAERLALVAEMARLGPDAPTLCMGWTTRDLAAHIIVRERRPDAALGIVVRAAAGHNRKVQQQTAGQDFPTLLAQLREPPAWSPISNPLLDEAVNVNEMFVHHEDVRRAQAGWSPRPLDPGHQAALWRRLRRTARLVLRRVPATVVLDAGEYGAVSGGAGGARVTVSGDPGELSLFLSGRQGYAQVRLTGDEVAGAQLTRARLGV